MKDTFMSLPVGPNWAVAHLILKFPLLGLSALATTIYVLQEEPKPLVAITFDDGYQSVLDIAIPELSKRDMTATNYILLDYPGYENLMMEHSEITKFTKAGWEVGSHSINHANMTTLSDSELASQLENSKSELESFIGRKVVSFSSPYGAFDDNTVDHISGHYDNHVNAWSPERGMNTVGSFDPYNIHRIDYSNTSVEEICDTVNNMTVDDFYVVIFHNISTEKNRPREFWGYDITPQDLISTLDCIDKADVQSVTISEGVNIMMDRMSQ
jgi:peptidoglycan/xylan/chitin deacetylase (PgdA/CDA1 family)